MSNDTVGYRAPPTSTSIRRSTRVRDRIGTRMRRLDPAELWYVIWFAFLVFQPAFDPTADTIDWVATGVLIAVGVVVAIVGETSTGHDRIVAIVAFAVLGVAGVWVNGGAAIFFVYAAAGAGTLPDRATTVRWQAGLTIVILLLIAISPIPFPYRLLTFGIPLFMVWVIGYEVSRTSDTEREAGRLRVDNVRIGHLATVSERERIARDLHDLLGQSLTGVVVRAQLVRRLIDVDPARATDEVARIERIARDALTEVRATVGGWRRHRIVDEVDVASDALAAADIDLALAVDPDVALTPATESALGLALREAVTNVVRHARASTCTVALHAEHDTATLVVADDGVGGWATEGCGLSGMRERVAAAGGTVTRDGGIGTTVVVRVPLSTG